MALSDWKRKKVPLVDDIRLIIEADQSRADAPEHECRAWARAFIRKYIPRWHPGDPIEPELARLIGGAFERAVGKAKRVLKRRRQWRTSRT